MKEDIYRASYIPEGLDLNDENLEDCEGADLGEVVRQAKALNYTSSEECYRARRLTWEKGMGQYTVEEYFDCITLESC